MKTPGFINGVVYVHALANARWIAVKRNHLMATVVISNTTSHREFDVSLLTKEWPVPHVPLDTRGWWQQSGGLTHFFLTVQLSAYTSYDKVTEGALHIGSLQEGLYG